MGVGLGVVDERTHFGFSPSRDRVRIRDARDCRNIRGQNMGELHVLLDACGRQVFCGMRQSIPSAI